MMQQLSTPHGTLGTSGGVAMREFDFELSTPHGTLGTEQIAYARNVNVRYFQLHTVH